MPQAPEAKPQRKNQSSLPGKPQAYRYVLRHSRKPSGPLMQVHRFAL
jgi:hypothetical protein